MFFARLLQLKRVSKGLGGGRAFLNTSQIDETPEASQATTGKLPPHPRLFYWIHKDTNDTSAIFRENNAF